MLLLRGSKHIVVIIKLLIITVVLESYPAMVWVIADKKVVRLFLWRRVVDWLLLLSASEEA